MPTKTITITTDAYNLLRGNKLESESFSPAICRLFSLRKTRNVLDFYGLLVEEYAEENDADL